MRFLTYWITAGMLAGGAAVWAVQSSTGASEQERQEEPGEQKRSPQEIEEELEDFVPSEKVPADSAVSFPVDI